MLCDGCKKKEASIMLHMITNGQVSTRSLCASCAQKAHSQMSQAFTTMGMQMEGLNGMVETPRQEELRLPKMICSACRTPYEDIDHNTLFGCKYCYGAFHQLVVDYLSGLRGEPKAIVPLEEITGLMPSLTQEELKERLQDAVNAEDYEQAASLRDEIQRTRPDAQEHTDA